MNSKSPPSAAEAKLFKVQHDSVGLLHLDALTLSLLASYTKWRSISSANSFSVNIFPVLGSVSVAHRPLPGLMTWLSGERAGHGKGIGAVFA